MMRAKLARLLRRVRRRQRKITTLQADHVNCRCDLSDVRIAVDPTLAPGEWYLEHRPYSFGMVDWRTKPYTGAEERRARRILFRDDDDARGG
jgi:hypothetical protein